MYGLRGFSILLHFSSTSFLLSHIALYISHLSMIVCIKVDLFDSRPRNKYSVVFCYIDLLLK